MKKDHRMGKGFAGIFKIYFNVPFLPSLFLSLSLLFSFFLLNLVFQGRHLAKS